MSQSKRQVIHPVGEPRTSEVALMRHAVQERKRKDLIAEAKRDAKKHKLADAKMAKAAAKMKPPPTVPDEPEISEPDIVDDDPDTA